jgi:hypothetical protein
MIGMIFVFKYPFFFTHLCFVLILHIPTKDICEWVFN